MSITVYKQYFGFLKVNYKSQKVNTLKKPWLHQKNTDLTIKRKKIFGQNPKRHIYRGQITVLFTEAKKKNIQLK